MKIMLDTHLLLWTLSNDGKLPEKARRFIENVENEIYVSLASFWEIELKCIAHPDAIDFSAADIYEYCRQSGFKVVPIKANHIFYLSNLKRASDAPAHKDPFDRLLICQASVENMLFITHDRLLEAYIEPCVIYV